MTPRLFAALVALPLLADMLDRFIAWAAKRYRKEIEEGDEYPPFGWVLWVRVTHRNPDYDHDLWVVKLPFYQWTRVGWCDGDNESYGWTQLAFMHRGPFARRELCARAGWRPVQIVSQVANASYP